MADPKPSPPPRTAPRTTLAWLLGGEDPPTEVEARLNRIEDALDRIEAAMKPEPRHEP